MSGQQLDLPSVGAKVRHTSTYQNGLVLTLEGRVHEIAKGHCMYLGDANAMWMGPLSDQDSCTVTWEVIAAPIAPEPPSGGAAATSGSVWLHAHCGWFDGFVLDSTAKTELLTWQELNDRHPEVRVLVYDPADDGPELPFQHRDEDGNEISIWPREGLPGFIVSATTGVQLDPDAAERAVLAIWRRLRDNARAGGA